MWVDHRANCNRKTAKSLVEQLSVCACPHKVDGISIKLIDQQEITADMAFSVIDPLAFEWVIKPFGAKRRIAGYQQHHGLLESMHVVAARA
jgi:hypothetical protein